MVNERPAYEDMYMNKNHQQQHYEPVMEEYYENDETDIRQNNKLSKNQNIDKVL